MKRNILIIGASIVLLFVFYAAIQLFLPLGLETEVIEIQVPEGATLKQALNILAQQKLVRDKNLFLILGKLTGVDRKIRAGYYSILGSMNPWQVFTRIREGRIVEYDVTVIEGDTLTDIGPKFEAKKIVSREEFMLLAKDKGLLNSLGVIAPSLEGYLYPQTYKVPKGMQAESVLRHMVQKFREEYTADLRERARELGWSENKVLTLASIIEREAVDDKERPLISAVYHNRIRLGMPLQADPTAVYGVKSYRERITRKDLKSETEYNTYFIKGLPPGPIASPGFKSVRAALFPADVPYLYFVAKKDGTHYFSRTLAEHNANIARVRAPRQAARNEDDDS